MTKILLASGNPHKRAELQQVLGAGDSADVRSDGDGSRSGQDLDWSLLMPSEVEVSAPIPDPIEDGDDYTTNAAIKARAFSEWSGLTALSDDTGLEVEALDGAPGVHSARYAGAGATDRDNVDKLLAALHDVENRRARFVTVIVVCRGEQLIYRAEGVCHGTISTECRGQRGFGYDPVFIPDAIATGEVTTGGGHGVAAPPPLALNTGARTFAELDAKEKNRISHRGRALQQLAQDIRSGKFPIHLARQG